jgi:hypothetical protein
MQKIFNHKFLIVIFAIVAILVIIFSVRSCIYSKEVQATVSPLNIEQGAPIHFSDSTRGASRWYWEFGNGDSSSEQRGTYIFPETGRYQIRLTVDGSMEQRFIVTVRPSLKDTEVDELIRISAPSVAFQGEFITFRGVGNSREWRWAFGETGDVDAIEKTAIYHYGNPGIYTVELRTEETMYPIRHEIEILPRFSEDDTDVAAIIGEEIRERLQAIVNQQPFNTHYNYILNTFLNGNANTIVIVNNNRRNDFYSYCKGLKIIGRNRTIIQNVVIDMDDNDEYIRRLIVFQTDSDME